MKIIATILCGLLINGSLCAQYTYSNKEYATRCGANEDGYFVSNVFEIQLPCEPIGRCGTCQHDFLIFPDSTLVLINQVEPSLDDDIISRICNLFNGIVNIDIQISQILDSPSSNFNLMVNIIDDFIIVIRCRKNELIEYMNSVKTFKVVEQSKIIPFERVHPITIDNN